MKFGKTHPPQSMFLRQHVGEADGRGFNFEMSVNCADFSPIVHNKQTGKWFTLSWSDILELAALRGLNTEEEVPRGS